MSTTPDLERLMALAAAEASAPACTRGQRRAALRSKCTHQTITALCQEVQSLRAQLEAAKKLTWCDCGDQFTAIEPGKCGNCHRVALMPLEMERDQIADLLPGTTYMDPPDGGAPTLVEQVRRIGEDAARYRWLARKVSAHGICDGWQFGFPTALSLPAPPLAMRDPEAALGQAIDAARKAEGAQHG